MRLQLDGVVKRFGPVRALDGASLDVRGGSLHAVLGENGAGKTTLMRVAFGLLQPDAGTVRLDGTPRRLASPADAIAAGVGMVHQHFTIVPAMTVAENVALGGRGRYDARAAAEVVRRVGAQTGLALDPAARAADLPVAAQQRLEIVKALARDARLLILDEPAAVLTPAEARELLTWLRRFVDGGATAVLITHKLRDALAFADDVTVLRRGRTVATSPAAATDEAALTAHLLGEAGVDTAAVDTAGVATAGVGRAHYAVATPAPSTPAVTTPAVSARGLSYVDARGVTRLRDATFEVRTGELLGVVGVEGSGQHELLRLLAGRLVPSGGALDLPARVAWIPEDRHRDALLLDGTLVENLALRGAGAHRGLLPWPRLARRARALVDRFDVRAGATGVRLPARALSGGNQQKFVVARELAGDADAAPPELVVAENPTRGLDVRATAAVLARLREARAAGAAVVFYSSDLDEVLALADRVLVVYDGRVRPTPAERDAVGRAMLGAA
ncbi:ATP-binding cassette domain-containing protein [Roseisolibacter sp. H3M3-2]|uniref:ABC transporter ATP-binding protein n=1 Tax=Roseisolibacter sp. H3M3-2 TaxID=3031323 RepID=UPI0023DA0F8D|nr:ATP-binding cassette domain-containing protein [Roseisolibacter sp. H3M3-2]MDF1501614.1 ATP-binding cassette domain-containing protein [Roseisolibacter sp. H3M3-2]